MPATCRKLRGRWRVVHRKGKRWAPVMNAAGTAVDGGGHKDKRGAMAQARAINANTQG